MFQNKSILKIDNKKEEEEEEERKNNIQEQTSIF